jgi:hypothetical protein
MVLPKIPKVAAAWGSCMGSMNQSKRKTSNGAVAWVGAWKCFVRVFKASNLPTSI